MSDFAIEIGLSKCKIIGNMDPDAYAALRTAISFRPQGYFFSADYRSGVWDGRKHLITEKGQQFSIGLLARVMYALQVMGYAPKLIDKRTMPAPSQFMPVRIEETLRPYQVKAVADMIAAVNGVCRIATGGGKTRVGAAIIAELERPAIFIVNRLDLMTQVLGVLRSLMVYPQLVGQVGNGVYEPNVVTVCTVQTLAAAFGVKYEDEDHAYSDTSAAAHAKEIVAMIEAAQVIVVDECHHVPAATIYSVLEKAKNAGYRIGLSATDWRDDGADMMIEAALGPRVVDVKLSDLIALGFLVPAHITMEEIAEPPEGNDSMISASYPEAQSYFIVKNLNFHQQVAKRISSWHAAGRSVLTLVERIEHGRTLAKMLTREHGVKTVFLSGKDSPDTRDTILDDVRSGRLRSLIATSIADEGLDLPAADALVLAGGGKSSTRAYQRIGRVLRPSPGKEYGLVADYRCPYNEHLKRHAATRLRIYKAEPGFQITKGA